MDTEGFLREHEILYSGNSLMMGRIHWHILKANSELERRSKKIPQSGEGRDHFNFHSAKVSLTDFGKEVLGKEIHWWIYKQETDFEDLKSKTESTLRKVQKLKEDAQELERSFITSDYKELILRLKSFTDEHEKEICSLYDYVIYLENKDILAPCVLFSYDTWGSTRLSERIIKITKGSIDEDFGNVQNCTDIALGILCGGRPVITREASEMDSEIYDRLDPEDYQRGRVINRKELFMRTSRSVLDEFQMYFENIRNSLRKILKEIENFNCETSPIIRTIDCGSRIKDRIRFCLVQCDFSIKESPRTEPFGYLLDDEPEIKAKIFSALELGRENDVDIICFPELSFEKSWIEEIRGKYNDMVIVGGSYYDNGYNICPIIVEGILHKPLYAKCNPASSEQPIEAGRGMKCGRIVYNFQTKFGNFSVLNCIDYPHISTHVIKNGGVVLDFIINPSYDSNVKRFESQCNLDCENSNITVIRVNKAGERFGGSSIFCKEHQSIIDRFESSGWRKSSDQKYRLIGLNGEQIIIVDIDVCKNPSVDLPIGYSPRTSIIADYRLLDGVWKKAT